MSLCSRHWKLKERIATTSNFCPVCDLIRKTRDEAYEHAAKAVNEHGYVIPPDNYEDEIAHLHHQRKEHVEVILSLRGGR